MKPDRLMKLAKFKSICTSTLASFFFLFLLFFASFLQNNFEINFKIKHNSKVHFLKGMMQINKCRH